MAEVISKRIAVIPVGREQAAESPSRAESRLKEVNRNLIFVALVLGLVFIGCSLSMSGPIIRSSPWVTRPLRPPGKNRSFFRRIKNYG